MELVALSTLTNSKDGKSNTSEHKQVKAARTKLESSNKIGE